MSTDATKLSRRRTLQGMAAVGASAALAVGTLKTARASTDPGKEFVFKQQMRKLWEDHITWTRLYIISAIAGLPDLEPTTARLLRNQDDIGEAIASFYGAKAGEGLASLLKDHILGAATLLAAAKAGDQPEVDEASATWYANADDIGAFLHSANPDNWLAADMSAQMKMHLDMTLDEAVARLTGDFAGDIAAYDMIHDHILGMADVLSAGIIAQFPEQFVDSLDTYGY
jgi:hypothetical protein